MQDTQHIQQQRELLRVREEWTQVGKELTDVKDLMRKVREGEVKFTSSTYCFKNGLARKVAAKDIYPHLT